VRTSRTARRIAAVKGPRPPRPLLSVPDLVRLIGEASTLRLCQTYGGARVPYLLPYLQRRRAEAIAQGWGSLRWGSTSRWGGRKYRRYRAKEIAAFYGLSPSRVRAIIAEHRKAMRGGRPDATATGGPPGGAARTSPSVVVLA
jgi:hypothetical protein